MNVLAPVLSVCLAVFASGDHSTKLPAISAGPDSSAVALLDEGIRHMGGRERLEKIVRVRYNLVTEWFNTRFGDAPFNEGAGYERDTDVRDYSILAWRNTRSFGPVGSERSIVDLVRDTVAVRDFLHGEGYQPLNIAYVDERRELFAHTPDRLMLWARRDPKLRSLGDTMIAGVPHGRVRAHVGGFDMTLYLRRVDGLPARVRFRAAQPADFGLVPWGEMDVDVWYSNWKTYEGGVRSPQQWDVSRVGRPYKRLYVQSADFAPDFAADSFTVTDAERDAYFASNAVRPMHESIPTRGRGLVGDDFAVIGPFGWPDGAVRLDGSWLLLGTGQVGWLTRQAIDWLEAETGGPVEAALLGSVRRLSVIGGVSELSARGIPTTVAVGAQPAVDMSLAGHDVVADPRFAIRGPDRWVQVGRDSLRVETIDLPDATGSLIAWSPTLKWLYAPDADSQLGIDLALEYAERRGWDVERMRTTQGLAEPVGEGGER